MSRCSSRGRSKNRKGFELSLAVDVVLVMTVVDVLVIALITDMHKTHTSVFDALGRSGDLDRSGC